MVALLRRNPGGLLSGPVSVDWGHPLAQGLGLFAVCTPEHMGLDVTGFHHCRRVGAVVFSGNAYNSWGAAGFTSTACLEYERKVPSAPINGVTVMSVVVGGTEGWTISQDSNSGGRPFTFTPTLWYINGAGGGDTLSAAAPADRAQSTTVGTWSPTRMTMWRNGGLLTSKASARTSVPTGTTPTAIGRRAFSGYEEPFNGVIRAGALWTRGLTYDEAQWVSAEPYAMLIQGPIRSTFWLGLSTASPFRPQVIAA